jgi:hypothetical protein
MSTRSRNIPAILVPLIFATALGGIGPRLAIADIVNINPSKDNTLYEYVPANGDLSNALGNHFFTGETAMGELRRGVLAFDIAGNVPAGSTITSVTLTLNMSRTPSGTARTVELHRLLADWEGKGTWERQPLQTMPHGGTAFTIPFFGRPKAETFPVR